MYREYSNTDQASEMRQNKTREDFNADEDYGSDLYDEFWELAAHSFIELLEELETSTL